MTNLEGYAHRVGTIRKGKYDGLTVSIEKDPIDTTHPDSEWHLFTYDDGTGRLEGMPEFGFFDDTFEDEDELWKTISDELAVDWSDNRVEPVLLPELTIPLIAEFNGELLFFPTILAAEEYFTPVEVQRGPIRFFDAFGNVLGVAVLGEFQKGWLILRKRILYPVVKSDELASKLRCYLQAADLPEELSADLSGAPLPQLIERMAVLHQRSSPRRSRPWCRRGSQRS